MGQASIGPGAHRYIRVVRWSRPYIENYTVDASILDRHLRVSIYRSRFIRSLVNLEELFREVLTIDSYSCSQVSKSKRWMPWHLEPKKDVAICDKPRGADKRALIRGCPNGETPLGASCYPVTPA